MTVNEKWFVFPALLVLILCQALLILSISNILSRLEKFERGMFAYGFDEHTNVWNRIRVNDNGHVICQK